jgi:Putative polyhydroxyalkanoic acid system protein (PHA_gran_rgn)
MKHSVPHTVGKEMAQKVARQAFEAYKVRFSEFSPETTWLGEDKAKISFSAKGMSVKGQVAVTEKAIDIDLEVPFLLRPFQGKAIELIEREIKTWIGKAKSGELA